MMRLGEMDVKKNALTVTDKGEIKSMNYMSQMRCIVLIAGAVCSALTVSAFPEQNAKRVQEIAAMLRDDPGFPEMRIGNRAVWDALAKDANAASSLIPS